MSVAGGGAGSEGALRELGERRRYFGRSWGALRVVVQELGERRRYFGRSWGALRVVVQELRERR